MEHEFGYGTYLELKISFGALICLNITSTALLGCPFMARQGPHPWMALGQALSGPWPGPWLTLGLAMAGPWPGPGWPLAWPWVHKEIAFPVCWGRCYIRKHIWISGAHTYKGVCPIRDRPKNPSLNQMSSLNECGRSGSVCNV